jgi:glutamate-1-semialdehyde 2,1-aminomutase
MIIQRNERERVLIAEAERLLPTGTRCLTFENELNFMVGGARGSRLWDVSGNEYIDYLLGSGPHILGHAHPAITGALANIAEKGTSYLIASEEAVDVAKKIVEHVPCAERVTFHSSGSEATFFALRLARAFRRRDKILKFEGGYHGMHDYALMSNQWTGGQPPFPTAIPNTHGIPVVLREEVLVAPFNDLETTLALIEQHHDELAGVIVEPLQRSFVPRAGFLEGLREITRHYEIPLIFDEVVTGFRLGLGGAQTRYGVTPDLCALGKCISGGLPLGVLCGREDIMSLADPRRRIQMLPFVMLTGTFSSNPVVMSVARAIIGVLEQPETYARIEHNGRRLMSGLQQAMDEAGVAARVSGEPSTFQIWFTDAEPFNHRAMHGADAWSNFRFGDLLLREGVLKAAEKFFVSAAHTDADIDRTLAAFRQAAQGIAGERR